MHGKRIIFSRLSEGDDHFGEKCRVTNQRNQKCAMSRRSRRLINKKVQYTALSMH